MVSSKVRGFGVCIAIAFIAGVAGCASGPTLRTSYDKSAGFSSYKTFGFVKEPGTDRAGYTTLITTQFKESIQHQLEARGYAYVEENPDLLVNFNTNVSQQSEVHAVSSPVVVRGYHTYRAGLYTAWPMYDTDVFVDNYKVGTVNVDVVDAARMQLVWEGVAEGRLSEETLNDPAPAIDRVITDLFARYPATAGADAMPVPEK